MARKEALVVKREQASISRRARQPRIKSHAGLPEMVAVKYVAELSGQGLDSVVAVMSELRIIVQNDLTSGLEGTRDVASCLHSDTLGPAPLKPGVTA
jgi:hypothetical protein